MGFHDGEPPVRLADSNAEVADELVQREQLRLRWRVAVKITDQANAERDVIEVITMHMTAVDLPFPAIPHFDLPISRRRPIPDHELVREAIGHAPYVAMVVIEDFRIALSRAAVVDHDVSPSMFFVPERGLSLHAPLC